VRNYPKPPVPAGHVEPSPRRVRGVAGGDVIFDTTRALYVWEKPYYPWYAIPREDVARLDGLAHRLLEDTHVLFDWDALDAWFEEDEQIHVHPRNPYARVDAVRSSRTVRVELDGVLLAESSAPVLLFETGLPTRYYLDRTAVDFSHLEPSDTVTACPYKGRTTGYWSARTPTGLHADIAWVYDFPLTAVAPIAGLIAFYNEHVDLTVDGAPEAAARG